MKIRVRIFMWEPYCNGDNEWLFEDINGVFMAEGLLTVCRTDDYTISFSLERVEKYTVETYDD